MTENKVVLNSDLVVNSLTINNKLITSGDIENVPRDKINAGTANEFLVNNTNGLLTSTSYLKIVDNDIQLDPTGVISCNKDVVMENSSLFLDINKMTFFDVNTKETTTDVPTDIFTLPTIVYTNYIIYFDITAKNITDNHHGSYSGQVNVIQKAPDTEPYVSNIINNILTLDDSMMDTNVITYKTNNTFKIQVKGLNNKDIHWKSLIKISGNTGSQNIINNGNTYVQLANTDTNIVNVVDEFNIIYNNQAAETLLKVNSINNGLIKFMLMNNDVNKSFQVLYDHVQNKAFFSVNNQQIMNLSTTQVMMNKNLNMNMNLITGLNLPINDTDAVNKEYVDDLIANNSSGGSSNYTYILNTQNLTLSLSSSFALLNTNNGSYLNNTMVSNTNYVIGSNGLISINSTGTYEVQFMFDYQVDLSNIFILSSSFDGINTIQEKTNNMSNYLDTMSIKSFIVVSSSPKTFNLYLKKNIIDACNMTIKNLRIFIKKM